MIEVAQFWTPFDSKPVWNAEEAELWNPYLEELAEHLPTVYESSEAAAFDNCFSLRDRMVRQYAWAIPNRAAIETLRLYAPLLDAGAGTGYWAAVMYRAGIDVLPVDCDKNQNGYRNASFVLADAVEEIPKHPERNLFLCWPDFATSFAADCLNAFEGTYVLYVGEGEGGCTGDNDYHNELSKSFENIGDVSIPQWWGIHDYLSIHRRKGVSS